jgi:hypothetical protein
MNRILVLAAVAFGMLAGGCGGFDEALTGHSRPAAEAAGYRLSADNLGRLMAASPMPDSALTAYWAGELGRLWADYVILAALYQDPDTTRSVDYSTLLEDGRYLAALAVSRYRDSVVMVGSEPSEEELREYFDVRHPFTRLDVRRLVLIVPEDAPGDVRDSLFAEAGTIRERLVGGADFVEVARELSDEPAQARGQVLSYQGHDDFPDAADSIVFELRPGEISPVIAAGSEILVYRIEGRRTPDYEMARDQLYRLVLEERTAKRQDSVLEALVDDSHRAIMQGAVELAGQVARDPSLAAERIPGGMILVTWDGGDLSVEELRDLFLVRRDMQDVFAQATDDELTDYLLRLAGDEILITAAARSGMAATAAEKEELSAVLADQLARVAARYELTTEAVTDPVYDLEEQAVWFLQGVMQRSRAIPWLGEFRVVLDPVFPVRVDDGGADSAARTARELRAAGMGGPGIEGEAPRDGVEPRSEVG